MSEDYRRRVAADPQAFRDRAKRYRDANPEKMAVYRMRRRARRKALPSEKIEPTVVYDRDGWVCQLCDEPLEPDGPYGRRPSVDHIIPLALGGPHLYENVQAAHRSCNSGKKDRLRADNPKGLQRRARVTSPDTIRRSAL